MQHLITLWILAIFAGACSHQDRTKKQTVIDEDNFHIGEIAFAADGKSVICAGTELTTDSVCTWQWNFMGKDAHRRFDKNHDKLIQTWAVSFDQKFLLTGAQDHNVCLWEVHSGRRLQLFKGHTKFVGSVAFSRDGKLGVSGGDDNVLCIWNLKSGKVVNRIHTGGHVVHAVFSPDGMQIVSAGDKNGIKIWDIKSGKLVRRIGENAHSQIKFSPNGRYLCTAEYSRVRVFDFPSGREIRKFDKDYTSIWDIAVSPNGKLVMSGGRSGALYIWEIKAGKLLRTIENRRNISSVAFSPDSKLVAFCEMHRSLFIVNLGTGKVIHHSTIGDSSARLRRNR